MAAFKLLYTEKKFTTLKTFLLGRLNASYGNAFPLDAFEMFCVKMLNIFPSTSKFHIIDKAFAPNPAPHLTLTDTLLHPCV